jgi:hypothetical protein
MSANSLQPSVLKKLHKLLDKIIIVNDYDTRNSPEWLPFIVLTKYYRFLQQHQCWKYDLAPYQGVSCTREVLLDEITKYKAINYMGVDDQIVSSWWFGRDDGPAKDASDAFWNAMTDLEQILLE